MKNDYSDEAQKRAAELAPRATEKQTKFLEILLNDIGCHNRITRNTFLSDELGRPIRYMDDVTLDEATRLIDSLIIEREDS